MNEEYAYLGKELDLFQHALSWKHYWLKQMRPFLGKNVLEVGAGIGGTTVIFAACHVDSWTRLEPDAKMAAVLEKRKNSGLFPKNVCVQCGTTSSLPQNAMFDTILYIDVLEHIEDDTAELRKAAEHLTETGRIIVLSPAMNCLYSPFDKQVGHFRRYVRSELRQKASEAGLASVRMRYLDSLGFPANLTNRLFLRQSIPTLKQVMFWDRVIVPSSRYIFDWLLCYSFGKTVLGVFVKLRESDSIS